MIIDAGFYAASAFSKDITGKSITVLAILLK
jgi:hypothetical protein